ncbi:L,D-transpeptidase family protein [Glaciihabitans sp. UYNi722]|uniref:L,D-transpeptidase family protein n=1 Tax=Glaciihabitans sp. UYNi722 TaxID=3156344 RepID=UPI00339B1F94
MRRSRIAVTTTILGLAVMLLTGCATTSTTPPNPVATGPNTSTPTESPAPSVGTAATARISTVPIYNHPDGKTTGNFSNPQPTGAPLTFLVVDSQPGWIKVDLPQRPNGSTGWVSAATVTLNRLIYRLVVSTETNTLVLYKNSAPISTFTVATGTGGTPTPHGNFYLTELLRPTNTGYGPYAFGLSAYSDVLSSFGGGLGQIGLHGTNEASSIGKAASHGCIRMNNTEITTLATLLPLGTPITIN